MNRNIELKIDNNFINSLKKYILKVEEMYNRYNSLEKSNITVDRIEGDIAVCELGEHGKMLNINKELLPNSVKEGDILKFENNKYIYDIQENIDREKNIMEITKNLWSN